MDIPLDKSLEGYVADQVSAGEFESPADLVNDAVRMQQEYFRRRGILRREVQKGIDDIETGRLVPLPTLEELFSSVRARKQAS